MSDEGFLNEKAEDLLSIADFGAQLIQVDALSSLAGRGPDCPWCRANLAKSGARVCMHCGRDVAYIRGRCVTPGEAQAYRTHRDEFLGAVESKIGSIHTWELGLIARVKKGLINYEDDHAVEQKVNTWLKLVKSHEKRESRKREKRKNKIEEKARRQAREAFKNEYGEEAYARVQKKENIIGYLSIIACLFCLYGLYLLCCWPLAWLGFDPWFWASTPVWLYWGLIAVGPVLAYLCGLWSERIDARFLKKDDAHFLKKAEEEQIIAELPAATQKMIRDLEEYKLQDPNKDQKQVPEKHEAMPDGYFIRREKQNWGQSQRLKLLKWQGQRNSRTVTRLPFQHPGRGEN